MIFGALALVKARLAKTIGREFPAGVLEDEF